MGSNFKPIDRDTLMLLPPSLHDWLPDNHLARFVVEIISKCDLRAVRAQYAGRGVKAYQPEMLLSLLCYGYATGVFSSRKLERASYDSIAFRYITADQHPEHDTISDFRRRFLPFVTDLFEHVLLVAAESGMLKIGRVSIDGTKVKANASKHKAMSYDYATKLERQIKGEVARLLRLADEADNAPSDDGIDIPAELLRREDRLRAIDEAKARIREREKARIDAEQAIFNERLERRKQQEKESGKKPRGKKPKRPSKALNPQAQINFTDPESRIMPRSGGGFEQAYNAQNAVDCESRFILTAEVHQSSSDQHSLGTTINALCELPMSFGQTTAILADAGYFSKSNIEYCEEKSLVPYISDSRERRLNGLKRFTDPPPLRCDANAVDRARHRIRTKEGRAVYALRKSTVEPVFGIQKSAMGFRSFMLRSLEKVRAEWRLLSSAYNLRRLHVLTTTS